MSDVRIRRAVGNYRVVAPDAKNSGGTVYLNGALVIERRTKDALGDDIWVIVLSIARPKIDSLDSERAIYQLLGDSDR